MWAAAGKRQMKSFPTYSKAKRYGDDLVKPLAKKSPTDRLPPGQASDAEQLKPNLASATFYAID